jgi:hypothetical protein
LIVREETVRRKRKIPKASSSISRSVFQITIFLREEIYQKQSAIIL